MDDAIHWTIRLPTADAEGWREFTSWLSASPANLAAYERLAEVDHRVVEALDRGMPATSQPTSKVRSLSRWFGGLSTAAVAAVAIFMLQPRTPDLYPIETMPGVRQTIELQGGSEIHVNGASRLMLDRRNPRFARLESGEALFSVTTDPDNPFHVEAGGTNIRNVGTVFDVRTESFEVSVAVAEGAVQFDAGGQSTRLSVGETATFAGSRIIRGNRAAADIGGWRVGQLSFQSARLADVARDIERASGIPVSADPALAARRFSGSIRINDDREIFRRRLGAVLDVQVRLVGEKWVLAPTGK